MKYEFNKYIGLENYNAEGNEKMISRMVEVLHYTGVKVNFHILPKKERYFLCPIACVRVKGGQLIIEKVSSFSREPLNFSLDKNKMVQIIKKALKNKMRAKNK